MSSLSVWRSHNEIALSNDRYRSALARQYTLNPLLPFSVTPQLKPQEIPLTSPYSRYMFQPGPEKPLLATPAAIDLYRQQIFECLMVLQAKAKEHQGLDYLQVFEDPAKPEALWFIEDGDGGAITALLPSDY